MFILNLSDIYFLKKIYISMYKNRHKKNNKKSNRSNLHNNDELYTFYGGYKIFRTPAQRNEIKKCQRRNATVEKGYD